MGNGTFYPAASGDDSTWNSVDWNNNLDNLGFGLYAGSWSTHSAFRFVNVSLPAGATITTAFIRFTANGNQSGTPVHANCYFNDVDDATAPTSLSEAQNLVLTSAVAWNNVGAWSDGVQYDTPDLSSILQTVIDREGWASGQAIQFVIHDNSSTGIRNPHAIDGAGGAYKAELHVTWTEGITVSALPFELSGQLSAKPIYDRIITAPPFELSNELSGVPTTGVEIAAPAFECAGQMSASAAIIATAQPFTLTGSLQADQIAKAVLCEAFILLGDLSASQIESYRIQYPVTRFYFTLTGAPDGETDLDIPMGSFQTRWKSGDPTFLQVVIPGIDYSSEISARPNGEMVIKMGFEVGGVVQITEELIRVDLETIDPHEGGRNRSIVLMGHKTVTYENKTVALTGASYRRVADGKLRYRCDPHLYLRPGDTVNINDDSFTVGDIIMIINTTEQTMEIAEA